MRFSRSGHSGVRCVGLGLCPVLPEVGKGALGWWKKLAIGCGTPKVNPTAGSQVGLTSELALNAPWNRLLYQAYGEMAFPRFHPEGMKPGIAADLGRCGSRALIYPPFNTWRIFPAMESRVKGFWIKGVAGSGPLSLRREQLENGLCSLIHPALPRQPPAHLSRLGRRSVRMPRSRAPPHNPQWQLLLLDHPSSVGQTGGYHRSTNPFKCDRVAIFEPMRQVKSFLWGLAKKELRFGPERCRGQNAGPLSFGLRGR